MTEPFPAASDPTAFAPRTVVVTGATSGIGEATARALAPRVETLVLVGRDPAKLAALAGSLGASSRPARITTHVADLALLADVRRLATELGDGYPTLNVLVNNAGAYYAKREETSEGIERTFALNVLTPFLLTRLLHDRLRAASPSRVVQVASAAHSGTKLDLDDLEARRRVLRIRHLRPLEAGRDPPDARVRPAVDRGAGRRERAPPGVRPLRLRPEQRGRDGHPHPILRPRLGDFPARGAETPVYLATSPQVEGTTGEYFDKSRAVRSSRESYRRSRRPPAMGAVLRAGRPAAVGGSRRRTPAGRRS